MAAGYTYDIFKFIFFNKIFLISNEISLKYLESNWQ